MDRMDGTTPPEVGGSTDVTVVAEGDSSVVAKGDSAVVAEELAEFTFTPLDPAEEKDGEEKILIVGVNACR